MSERLLLNANGTIFQIYHISDILSVDEMMMMYTFT
jgi:hypothetical protein